MNASIRFFSKEQRDIKFHIGNTYRKKRKTAEPERGKFTREIPMPAVPNLIASSSPLEGLICSLCIIKSQEKYPSVSRRITEMVKLVHKILLRKSPLQLFQIGLFQMIHFPCSQRNDLEPMTMEKDDIIIEKAIESNTRKK